VDSDVFGRAHPAAQQEVEDSADVDEQQQGARDGQRQHGRSGRTAAAVVHVAEHGHHLLVHRVRACE